RVADPARSRRAGSATAPRAARNRAALRGNPQLDVFRAVDSWRNPPAAAGGLMTPAPFANAMEHLLPLLERLDLLLHRQVLRLRPARLMTEEEFRGLYIPDEQVDRLLRPASEAETEPAARLTARLAKVEAELAARASPHLPLTRLAVSCGLSQFECGVLM